MSVATAIAPAARSLLASPLPPKQPPPPLDPHALFASCLPLAASLARKIHGGASWLDPEDMLAEANLSLWRAALAFDVGRGLKFTTLAQTYVERHLWRYVEREARRRRIRCVRLASRDEGEDFATDGLDALPDPEAVEPCELLTAANKQALRRAEKREVRRRLLALGVSVRNWGMFWRVMTAGGAKEQRREVKMVAQEYRLGVGEVDDLMAEMVRMVRGGGKQEPSLFVAADEADGITREE